jgi:hypothetical protein
LGIKDLIDEARKLEKKCDSPEEVKGTSRQWWNKMMSVYSKMSQVENENPQLNLSHVFSYVDKVANQFRVKVIGYLRFKEDVEEKGLDVDKMSHLRKNVENSNSSTISLKKLDGSFVKTKK